MAEFKPNIYPIMYWGLMFGLIAGFVLFAMFLLSRYITVIWFPVFLAGVIWGGYRNYRKQRQSWRQESGLPLEQAGDLRGASSAVKEIKEAARDIMEATKDMMAEQPPEEVTSPETAEKGENDQSRSSSQPG